MRSWLGNCSAILLFAAPLLAQRPEARRHLAEGVGLFHEHDDSGDALVAAQKEFAAALRLESRYAVARAYQGLIDLEMDHTSYAEAAFRDALSWDPKCAEALVGQARLNQKLHPPGEWLPLLRQAVAVAPRNALARRELAYAVTAESRNPTPAMWQEGMECWRVLIAIDRNDRIRITIWRARCGASDGGARRRRISAKFCASGRPKRIPTCGCTRFTV